MQRAAGQAAPAHTRPRAAICRVTGRSTSSQRRASRRGQATDRGRHHVITVITSSRHHHAVAQRSGTRSSAKGSGRRRLGLSGEAIRKPHSAPQRQGGQADARVEIGTLYLGTVCFGTTVPSLVLEFGWPGWATDDHRYRPEPAAPRPRSFPSDRGHLFSYLSRWQQR
jgi:hypothetical protein